MLVTSIFSFSHNVFKRLLSQCHKKAALCSKGYFQHCVNCIVTASAPPDTFLDLILLVLYSIFFHSHWLLSLTIIIETMVSGEGRMSPVTVISILKRNRANLGIKPVTPYPQFMHATDRTTGAWIESSKFRVGIRQPFIRTFVV